MRFGIIVSIILVAIVVLFVIVRWRGVSDAPTRVSAPDRLVRRDLPSGLPHVYEPALPEADADHAYERALELYERQQATCDASPPYPAKLRGAMTDLLVTAMRAARVREGFLDEHVPLRPNARPGFGPALESIPLVVLDEATARFQDGDADGGRTAAAAVFALGHRAFRDNRRLYVRWAGVLAMMQGLSAMLADADPGLEAWVEPLREIRSAWEPKMEALAMLRPEVGDVLRIAARDQDPTFRVKAVLALGYLQHNPRTRGNLRAIRGAIAAAGADADPLIAAAGRAAAAYTRDQIRRSR